VTNGVRGNKPAARHEEENDHGERRKIQTFLSCLCQNEEKNEGTKAFQHLAQTFLVKKNMLSKGAVFINLNEDRQSGGLHRRERATLDKTASGTGKLMEGGADLIKKTDRTIRTSSEKSWGGNPGGKAGGFSSSRARKQTKITWRKKKSYCQAKKRKKRK